MRDIKRLDIVWVEEEHKTRGVYKEITKAEINSVRLRIVSDEEAMVDVVSSNILEEDFSFLISKTVDLNLLKKTLQKADLSIAS